MEVSTADVGAATRRAPVAECAIAPVASARRRSGAGSRDRRALVPLPAVEPHISCAGVTLPHAICAWAGVGPRQTAATTTNAASQRPTRCLSGMDTIQRLLRDACSKVGRDRRLWVGRRVDLSELGELGACGCFEPTRHCSMPLWCEAGWRTCREGQASGRREAGKRRGRASCGQPPGHQPLAPPPSVCNQPRRQGLWPRHLWTEGLWCTRCSRICAGYPPLATPQRHWSRPRNARCAAATRPLARRAAAPGAAHQAAPQPAGQCWCYDSYLLPAQHVQLAPLIAVAVQKEQ